jgi:hypothetical protein
MVPSYVGQRLLPLVAACWLFGIRLVAGIILIGAGLAPRLVPPPGAG